MRARSLWPREHGAYFQLGTPLAAACALRVPTLATIALALGAVLAFLANEPLLVVLGHRGVRRRDHDGARARRRLQLLVAGAILLGAAGLALAPHAVPAAIVAALPVALLLAFAVRRAEHSLAGELVAAGALSAASVPALVAAGGSLTTAAHVWLAWVIGFGASVLAVHRVIARHKRPAARIDTVLAVVLLALVLGGTAGIATPLVLATPLVALSALLVVAPPPAARLRAVGVAIAAASVAVGALAVVAR